MRGKGKPNIASDGSAGITPAYAGKRARLAGFALPHGDHPRVCGEKPDANRPGICYIGSPPRMRGKGPSFSGFFDLLGITPAYAGKRAWPSSWRGPPQDHPRVCGEKVATSRMPSRTEGSPPRMRGKGKTVITLSAVNRITPAYAGKSPPPAGCSRLGKDHPRVCGEKTKKIP